MKARIGDSVLARFEVVGTTLGSTHNLYPGICCDGVLTRLEKLDIVSVEQEFRVGDFVQKKDEQFSGCIIALTPASVTPPKAWVNGQDDMGVRTCDLRSLTRLEVKK